MGVRVYWILIGLTLMGVFVPKDKRSQKMYIIFMVMIHTFVCGFRYKFLVGDLIKTSNTFSYLRTQSYFSEAVLSNGRNSLYYILMKFFADVSGGNFQVFLFFLAVVTQVSFGIFVYRYSPIPWMSFLVWNCMSFYVTYSLCSIKQGLAMSLVMMSIMAALENRLGLYMILSIAAGFTHGPAFACLPLYWIIRKRVDMNTVTMYVFIAFFVFLARGYIVSIMQDIYYDAEVIDIGVRVSLGGRFFLIILITAFGAIVRGFNDHHFEMMFNIMVLAAIMQMFGHYNNVFTRLTDYYFQFSCIYIPMIFVKDAASEVGSEYVKPLLNVNGRSLIMLLSFTTIALIWWYNRVFLGLTISYAVDDATNFRFMWEVEAVIKGSSWLM